MNGIALLMLKFVILSLHRECLSRDFSLRVCCLSLCFIYLGRKKWDEKVTSWNRPLWHLAANGCSSPGGYKHLFQCVSVVLAVFPEGKCWLGACGLKKCPQTRPDLISRAEVVKTPQVKEAGLECSDPALWLLARVARVYLTLPHALSPQHFRVHRV